MAEAPTLGRLWVKRHVILQVARATVDTKPYIIVLIFKHKSRSEQGNIRNPEIQITFETVLQKRSRLLCYSVTYFAKETIDLANIAIYVDFGIPFVIFE